MQVAGSSPTDRRQTGHLELKNILESLRVKGRSMNVPSAARKSVQNDHEEIHWGFLVLKLMANDRDIMPGQWKKFRTTWSSHLEGRVRER